MWVTTTAEFGYTSITPFNFNKHYASWQHSLRSKLWNGTQQNSWNFVFRKINFFFFFSFCKYWLSSVDGWQQPSASNSKEAFNNGEYVPCIIHDSCKLRVLRVLWGFNFNVKTPILTEGLLFFSLSLPVNRPLLLIMLQWTGTNGEG